MALNSRVGSFKQQIGHQTYKMTDDLRALCPQPSCQPYPQLIFTDDLGALLIRGADEGTNRATGPCLWITTNDLGTFR